MTDKELIQAFRRCNSHEVCPECPFDGKTECPIAEFTAEKLVDRLEALLAENAEMNIQIQKEICKRVDVEAKNEHLREVTKMVPKWVSVKERLPEEYRNEYGELKCHLVCTEDCVEPFRAFYDGKHWGDGWMVLDVTHWMPLPEPPSTEGVE